ncbi:MAG: hypothetical protein ACREUV_02245, partial [Burkholderiales bacterium]
MILPVFRPEAIAATEVILCPQKKPALSLVTVPVCLLPACAVSGEYFFLRAGSTALNPATAARPLFHMLVDQLGHFK